MTTANGTMKYCDKHVVISLTCVGPSCKGLVGNFTCSQPNSTYWVCNNSLTCSGKSFYSSTFSLDQPHVNVTGTQHLDINGTEFTLTQSSSGNVRVTNGTTSSSSTKSHAAYSRKQDWLLFVMAFVLVLLVPEAIAQNRFPCVDGIAADLHLVASAIEGDLNGINEVICEHFDGKPWEALIHPIGVATGIALCLQRGLVIEGALIPAAAAAGAATGVGEVVVAAGFFALNNILAGFCLGLVACLAEVAADQPANHWCSSQLSSATTSGEVPEPTSSVLGSTSAPAISQQATPSPTPAGPVPNLAIPPVATDKCASCQLSAYAMAVLGLSSQCHVAKPLGLAADVSVFFCDSSFNGRYASFCKTLCASPCSTYDINSWIQSAGSGYMPSASLPECNKLCPGFKGDGRCPANNLNCECQVGSVTCVKCF